MSGTRSGAAVADAALPEALALWRRLIATPSPSMDAQACTALAHQLVDLLRSGPAREVRLAEVPGHGPVVCATFEGSRQDGPEYIFYQHYDVVQTDPADWTHEPHAAVEAGGYIYGPGACDDKADVAARIVVLHQAWTTATPACTIHLVLDGAEEVGSPGLGAALDQLLPQARPQGVLWESYLREDGDGVVVGLGSRGALELELTREEARQPIHPSYAAIVEDPVADLVRAVAPLLGPYPAALLDRLQQQPVQPDRQALATSGIQLPWDEVGRSRDDHTQAETDQLASDFIYTPRITLASLPETAQVRTSIPSSASLSLRVGIVPGLDVEEVQDALTALIHEADPRVQVRRVRAIPPAHTDPSSAFVAQVREAWVAVRDSCVLYPLMTGAGPGHVFAERYGCPIASPSGTLAPGGGMHVADERGSIDLFTEHVRFTAELLDRLDGASSAIAEGDDPPAVG